MSGISRSLISGLERGRGFRRSDHRVHPPLVDRAGLVGVINDAWAMLAAIIAFGMLVLLFVRVTSGRR